jgi:hypothetical protein
VLFLRGASVSDVAKLSSAGVWFKDIVCTEQKNWHFLLTGLRLNNLKIIGR